MSILYFQIINLETQNIIGVYEHPELKNTSLKKELEDKSKELIPTIQTVNKSIKNHFNFKNDSNKTIEIYYLSTNSGTLYLSFIELTSESSKTFKDNYVYELLENIDSQNIKKFVNDDDKLTNVGLQNLRMSIDNYHNTYNYDSGESLIEDDPQSNKISIINNQINDVKNDMKENVKNMMNNMSDMNEIEGKSVSIKDTSFQFQRDSKNLENKMKKAAVRNKVILFITFTALLALVIYILVK
jgi:hypothetical protein